MQNNYWEEDVWSTTKYVELQADVQVLFDSAYFTESGQIFTHNVPFMYKLLAQTIEHKYYVDKLIWV